MAKSALPLLVLAGAAAVLMSGKKKKRKSSAGYEGADYESYAVPPTPSPPAATKTTGPSGKAAGSDIWKQRQTALAFVAGMKVCNCHPGNIDGLYGPATINAIIAFQVCTDIGVDGKWGPQTDAMMKRILTQIAEGQVYIKKPQQKAAKSSSETKTLQPQISISNNRVITTDGHKYNLNAWAVPNLSFCHGEFERGKVRIRCFGPAGIPPAGKTRLVEDFNEWGGKKRIVALLCNEKEFVPVVEVARNLALHRSDLFFVVFSPNNRFVPSERMGNVIALYDDIDEARKDHFGGTYQPWEKKAEVIVVDGKYLENGFKSMHMMGIDNQSEYKKKLEEIMWLLLADLTAKVGWY